MDYKKLIEVGEWLNTKGFDLDLKDCFWMEDYRFDEFKVRDIIELLEEYREECEGETSPTSDEQLLQPDVISSVVCGHPPKQTYLIDGNWHCEECGGKWKSIASK